MYIVYTAVVRNKGKLFASSLHSHDPQSTETRYNCFASLSLKTEQHFSFKQPLVSNRIAHLCAVPVVAGLDKAFPFESIT